DSRRRAPSPGGALTFALVGLELIRHLIAPRRRSAFSPTSRPPRPLFSCSLKARIPHAHCVRQGQSRPTGRERRAPALWRGGEVQLDHLAAGARARLGGDLSGTGLEDQRRSLLGAVDADPGAEHPAARAVPSRLDATSTSGSTAFTCRPVSKTPRNACSSSSEPHPRAGRSLSASPTVCARVRSLGGNCSSI